MRPLPAGGSGGVLCLPLLGHAIELVELRPTLKRMLGAAVGFPGEVDFNFVFLERIR